MEPFLSNESPINVAVVGVGAFGRNHARVYRQLEQAGRVRLVGVVDPDTVRADAVAREFDCKAFGSIEQMLTTHSEVQAASVAVPTVLHLDVARKLMQSGVDVLIEKPLWRRLDIWSASILPCVPLSRSLRSRCSSKCIVLACSRRERST